MVLLRCKNIDRLLSFIRSRGRPPYRGMCRRPADGEPARGGAGGLGGPPAHLLPGRLARRFPAGLRLASRGPLQLAGQRRRLWNSGAGLEVNMKRSPPGKVCLQDLLREENESSPSPPRIQVPCPPLRSHIEQQHWASPCPKKCSLETTEIQLLRNVSQDRGQDTRKVIHMLFTLAGYLTKRASLRAFAGPLPIPPFGAPPCFGWQRSNGVLRG